jgi:hypothetical protein
MEVLVSNDLLLARRRPYNQKHALVLLEGLV